MSAERLILCIVGWGITGAILGWELAIHSRRGRRLIYRIQFELWAARFIMWLFSGIECANVAPSVDQAGTLAMLALVVGEGALYLRTLGWEKTA